MKKTAVYFSALLLFAALCSNAQPVLYGMTAGAQLSSNFGNVFKYDVATGILSVEAQFCQCGNGGTQPKGSLVEANNGLLYGFTSQAGENGQGEIFQLSTSPSQLTFVAPGTGISPASFVQAYNGLLYSVSQDSIFSFNTQTNTIHNLFAFPQSGVDGVTAYGSLYQASDSLLYGTTLSGGVYEPVLAGGLGGVLYSYNIVTGQQTVLHSFGNGDDGNTAENPVMQASNGLLYGLTPQGGIQAGGALYSYDITTGQETVLQSFGTGSQGGGPYGGLIQASDGLLYGVTKWGGAKDGGVIFVYNIVNNTYNEVHNFGIGEDGKTPENSTLMQASDGLLYGETALGGANGFGCLFSYNIQTGVETVVHSFNDTDGSTPTGALIEPGFVEGIKQVPAPVVNNSLQVFPNPSTGRFSVQLPVNQNNYPVEVYDILGQKVEQLVLTNTQNTIDLSNRCSGAYFIFLKLG